MPNKPRFQSRGPKRSFKSRKNEEDFSDDEDPLFYDKEFVLPEDADELDEPDEEDLEKMYAQKPEEEENFDEEGGEDFEGDFDEEGDEFPEEEDLHYEEPEQLIIEKIPINEERLNQVIEKADGKSKKALKMFLKIFNAAIVQGTEDEDQERDRRVKVEYEVEDGEVYNKVITYALSEAPVLLKYHIEHVRTFKHRITSRED
jgi:hypothetical protein